MQAVFLYWDYLEEIIKEVNMRKILAFDLGSSSVRAILGIYEKEKLQCKEIHRFENQPVYENGKLCWNFPVLMKEVKKGIQIAGKVDSIGFDSWGADFGMLDESNSLLGLPVHYRDPRTEGMTDKVWKKIPEKRLFQMTGNQTYATNSLYQILACKEKEPETWNKVRRILHIPDLFHYLLTGIAVCERTIASTAQILDPFTKEWNPQVMKTFGIPQSIFAPLVDSGTMVGSYEGAAVTAVAGHDTQSAGAALTKDPENTAFLNIGTWSLMGMDQKKPMISDEAFKLGISNEQSAFGEAQCLMNMTGMWLLQECRRQWAQQGMDYSFDQLEIQADEEDKDLCLIDVNSPEFIAPGNMPEKIQQYCERTGQKKPDTAGEITRCIYKSLVCEYRRNLECLEKGRKKRIAGLQILGGGVRSPRICQMTADMCGRTVTAGPAEATALGNILLQLMAMGEIRNRDEGRRLIRDMEKYAVYRPSEDGNAEKIYESYLGLLQQEKGRR